MRVFKTKLIRLQLTAEKIEALTADFFPISVTVFCQIYLVAMHSTTTRLPGD